jgi:hypothetical protein
MSRGMECSIHRGNMGYLGRYPMGMWLCIISEGHSM